MSNPKILVVEDSPTYLRQISALLQGQGYHTIAAIDGEEAMERAIQDDPALIVLDVILPKKNGFQVCRQLKTSSATKNIKILMLTSKAQESDRFWGLKQGADAYMAKPFNENAFVAAIAKLMPCDPQAGQRAEGGCF